jgi:hypothetical protein
VKYISAFDCSFRALDGEVTKNEDWLFKRSELLPLKT